MRNARRRSWWLYFYTKLMIEISYGVIKMWKKQKLCFIRGAMFMNCTYERS